MTWKPVVDELEFRKRQAEQMGGPEGVARQCKQGKLTVREGIAFPFQTGGSSRDR